MKDPSDFRPYAWDLRAEIGIDPIVGLPSFTPSPSGLVMPTESRSVIGNVPQIWIGGGAVDEDYTVTCRAAPASGHVIERTGSIKVREL